MNFSNIINFITQLEAGWLVILLIMIVVWRVSKWKTTTDETLKVLQLRVDELKLRVDELKLRVDELKLRVDELKARVDDIWGLVAKHWGHPIEGANSPRALTDYGTSIAKDVNAKDIAKLFVDKISANAKEMNAYEIQEYCFEYAEQELLEELKNNHKTHYETITNYAYEKGMDISNVERVIGFVLRDAVLEKSGKPSPEIAQHGPEM